MIFSSGNHRGIGNISRCAEFNFWLDPEAANIVLAEATCPIKIVTWETCLDSSQNIPLKWRLEVLAGNKNPLTNLLDPVEQKCYANSILENWICCDNFLAVCFILPEIILKKAQYHATVELGGEFTRGMLVLDHLHTEVNNVEIIQEIDVEKFKKFMLLVCGHDVQFDFQF